MPNLPAKSLSAMASSPMTNETSDSPNTSSSANSIGNSAQPQPYSSARKAISKILLSPVAGTLWAMTHMVEHQLWMRLETLSNSNMKFPVSEITEDIKELQDRIKKTFFNDIFQIISQFETRSNVSATEIDARRAEGMLMVGPVLQRIMSETLPNAIDRTFAMASRAQILPPPPPELRSGMNIDIEFVSMLAQAQEAAAAGGIERVFGITGNVAGVDPAIMDVIDYDYGVMKYSSLLNNDPKLIRTPEAIKALRDERRQQQQQQAMAQQADTAQKLAGGAETLSNVNVGGGKSALQNLTGAS